MFEKDFAFVIANHPKRSEVLYKGTSGYGVFDLTVNKLFTEDGSSLYDKAYTLTFVTSSLPTIDNKHNIFIKIDGSDYRIINIIKESKFVTTLNLEEKK